MGGWAQSVPLSIKRHSLAGSHFVENTGHGMTGAAIAENFPDLFCREVRAAWGHCAKQAVPVLGRARAWIPKRDFLDWEGIVLRLSAPGQLVNMLFGLTSFDRDGSTSRAADDQYCPKYP